ncbi:MAG: adenylate/guanylate cyclase domain-containing protein [Desulfuromonadaceae bacterium]|nr:adenylate/guanylate cyclase domain-containing protein [Desulfuromonadaceae bacterium]MDD5107201.1 adenylate/guanylate cyclase domain-containing protein [Desulfuromonadaceae bacterium]
MEAKRARHGAITIVMAIIAAVFAIGLRSAKIEQFERIESRMGDIRFTIRGIRPPPQDVVIVAIDNKSIKELGRWPWPRTLMARLIDSLAAYGPGLTTLDVVFSETQDEKSDRALASALEANRNVILGYFFRHEQYPADSVSLEQIGSTKIAVAPDHLPPSLLEYKGVEPNIPEIGQAARTFGFFNNYPDADGIFRRAPLLIFHDNGVYPSLAISTVSSYLNAGVEIAPLRGGGLIKLAGREIPLNDKGLYTLNFYGPGGTIATVSATDLINRRVPRSALAGKLVFAGLTEIGIYDLRANPFDPAFPGVELHATLAGNILHNSFIHGDETLHGCNIAVIILLPLLLGILSGILPSTASAGIAVVTLSFSYLILNQLIFNRFGYDLTIIYPLCAMVLTSVSAEGYRNIIIERQGRYLKRAFRSYVAPELVDQLVANPERLKLGGEGREVTVIISDIRKFTSYSEQLGPEKMVFLLNRYLAPMTRIVMAEKGSLVQYVGDEIMALFNAPLDTPFHASCACRCALSMMERLQLLNVELKGLGLPVIDIGIGVNSGDVIVGNMGAEFRFQYSAVGDTVNLTSRLEGLNKFYGTHILVSNATRLMAGDEFFFREVDLVQVKGRAESGAIYELLSAPFPACDDFTTAVAHYRQRHFAEALEIFTRIGKELDDPVSHVYAGRCGEYLASPPSDEWNGVYVAPGK